MLTKLRESQERDEGFTLIELLVVVIIIGILAAVAIPVFLNQRESAWQRAAESDVRNAAIAVESFYTSTGSYPTAAEAGASWTPGPNDLPATGDVVATVTVSDGVELEYTPGTGGFTISAEHDQLDGIAAYYDSLAGGITDPPAGTGGG